MKRLLLLTVLLGWGFTASAAGEPLPVEVSAVSAAPDRASEILEKLAAGFRATGAYGVTFSVASGDYTAEGSYAVDGERYYLLLGDAEVFCDGKIRYEVDNRRREATVTDVDLTSRNILNNPAHAFDFLGSEYTPSLLWERDGKAAVQLTPASKNTAATGNITLTVSTATIKPLSLTYDYDGEHVAVLIGGVTPLRAPLKSFDKKAYADYEFIDFR